MFGGYGFGPGYDPSLPPQELAPEGLSRGDLAMIQGNDLMRVWAERQATLNWAAGRVRVPQPQVVVVQAPVAAPAAAPVRPVAAGPAVYRYRLRDPGLMDYLGAGVGHVLNAWLRLWRYANN